MSKSKSPSTCYLWDLVDSNRLEGISTDDIAYSCGYWDSAEIICYDFKEHALDLIQDIDLWGNLDNFIGTVDPENPFSGKSPRQDGLLVLKSTGSAGAMSGWAL